MGKKPVLGMVSAFCVGLALTGCKGANSRSEGPPVAKDNSSLYKTQPSFGPGSAGTASSNGWNTAPTAAKSAAPGTAAPITAAAPPSMIGADMRPMPPVGVGSTNVQPAGGLMPSGPLPPPEASPRPGQITDVPAPSGSTLSNFPPASDAHSNSRMLPPTPALPAPTSLPPLPEEPAPTPPGATRDVPTTPAPPLPASMRSLPGDLPPVAGPTPDVGPVPLPPPPAPVETPPLPEPPAPTR